MILRNTLIYTKIGFKFNSWYCVKHDCHKLNTSYQDVNKYNSQAPAPAISTAAHHQPSYSEHITL